MRTKMFRLSEPEKDGRTIDGAMKMFQSERLKSMILRVHSRLVAAQHSERGQAMTEYIFLVVTVALVCIPVFTLLPEAVRGYVRPIYYCLSRPFP